MGGNSASLNVHPHPIYVFDTSVLRSFAVVSRLDLLEQRYAGRARMTIEVRQEISSSVGHEPALAAVLAATWLLPPERSTAVDDIERIRLLLGGTGRDRKHLGEAGSIQVALERGWIVAIDDRDAVRYANAVGVGTIGTITILQVLVHDRVLSADNAVALRDEMVDVHGRRLPPVPESFFSSGDV